jgi:glycerol-3-phosphate acyltransferase PlsY
MEYLLSSLIGYLLGSVPAAYLIVNKVSKLDITKEGSGNVGALNSFEISKSKLVGLAVLIIDLLKGLSGVLIPILLFPGEFGYPAVGLFFSVFAHCYNPWLEFKGGRGLATAAGGAMIIFPLLLVLWCVLWVIFYLMKKNIHFANISSTIFSLLVVFGIPEIVIKYAFPQPVNESTLMMICSSVLVLIFVRHIEPLKLYLIEQKSNWKLKK